MKKWLPISIILLSFLLVFACKKETPKATGSVGDDTPKVTNIKFIPFGPYKVIGKEIKTKQMSETISYLWNDSFSDKTFDNLFNMKDALPTDLSGDLVGYMRDFNEKDNTFTYVVGLFMKPDTKAPAGYVSYDIPKCTVAVVWIEGKEFRLFADGPGIAMDAIEKNGYAVDQKNAFISEVYNEERFSAPKKKGAEKLTLDYYIPCVKK